jgi:TIR domain
MSSLADLSEIVGFFSYSREDDEAFEGTLSTLRDAIQRELSAQLGRSRANFRLWQDQAAIAPGQLWESEIKTAVEQAVFFIPIVTPRAVGSHHCKFEFEAFLARERALDRNDLVFPLLYIGLPALDDEAQWRKDPVLSIIGARQYVDWRPFRHRDIHEPAVREAIERFCSRIVEALRRPWVSPEERRKQQEIEAQRRAEGERLRQEAEAARPDVEERRRAEALKQAEALRAETAQQAAWEAQRAEAARRSEEQRNAEAARQAEDEKWRAETMPLPICDTFRWAKSRAIQTGLSGLGIVTALLVLLIVRADPYVPISVAVFASPTLFAVAVRAKSNWAAYTLAGLNPLLGAFAVVMAVRERRPDFASGWALFALTFALESAAIFLSVWSRKVLSLERPPRPVSSGNTPPQAT